MKIYRFAVHPSDDGYHHIACITDPALYTQARSMDEALFMARDVVHAMYGFEKKNLQIELVIPADVETGFEKRLRERTGSRRAGKRTRTAIGT